MTALDARRAGPLARAAPHRSPPPRSGVARRDSRPSLGCRRLAPRRFSGRAMRRQARRLPSARAQRRASRTRPRRAQPRRSRWRRARRPPPASLGARHIDVDFGLLVGDPLANVRDVLLPAPLDVSPAPLRVVVGLRVSRAQLVGVLVGCLPGLGDLGLEVRSASGLNPPGVLLDGPRPRRELLKRIRKCHGVPPCAVSRSEARSELRRPSTGSAGDAAQSGRDPEPRSATHARRRQSRASNLHTA